MNEDNWNVILWVVIVVCAAFTVVMVVGFASESTREAIKAGLIECPGDAGHSHWTKPELCK